MVKELNPLGHEGIWESSMSLVGPKTEHSRDKDNMIELTDIPDEVGWMQHLTLVGFSP